jgi:probable phosphoglycerate mutase
MPLIHLIRHGETDGNRSHYIGRRDLPLNATGLAQAQALAASLGAVPIRRIISSPLSRAQQTVQPLAARLDLPVEVAPALIEFDFGLMQDHSKTETALNLRKAHALNPVPGGESLHDVWTRLLPFATHLRDSVPGHDVAVVGHYWSNRMLFGLLNGLSFAQTLEQGSYRPETGSVTTIPRHHTCTAQG